MITFEQIIELEPYIRKCCYNICPDKDRIDDAIQSMYSWLCENNSKRNGLDFLDWKGQPNKHYLRRIASSKLLDALKYDKRRKAREQIVAKSETQLFDFDEPEREESEPYVDAVTLVSAINEEPEYNRELLKMVYFGKKIKQKKLAELLDIPYITLKQDVKKARESIKDKFEKKKGDSEKEGNH